MFTQVLTIINPKSLIMKATEQIEAIKKTLIDAETSGQLSIDMFTIIERQLITLQILVERDIVTAEQKGMTDAFSIINKIVTTNE